MTIVLFVYDNFDWILVKCSEIWLSSSLNDTVTMLMNKIRLTIGRLDSFSHDLQGLIHPFGGVGFTHHQSYHFINDRHSELRVPVGSWKWRITTTDPWHIWRVDDDDDDEEEEEEEEDQEDQDEDENKNNREPVASMEGYQSYEGMFWKRRWKVFGFQNLCIDLG